MSAKSNAVVGLSALLILLLMFYLGIWVSRDCYAASLFPRFYIAMAGAMIIGPLFLHLGPVTSSFPSKKAIGPVEQVISFGLMGFFVTWNWATAIPRFTAGSTLISQTAYVRVPGWKNCQFGVEFADAGGAGTVRVCGPLWQLPFEPERGTIRVTEKVGGLGIYLLKIEPS